MDIEMSQMLSTDPTLYSTDTIHSNVSSYTQDV